MARKCPVCGSRKWRKNYEGAVVCEDGHVLQGFRSESQVMTEPTAHALQKRTILKLKSGDKKRKERGQAHRDIYHGRAAELLRLQGLQLLLRYQIQALQKLWSIPDALEAIARDLWSYQLLISKVPLQSEERSPSPVRGGARKNSRKSLADDVTTPTPSDGEETERLGDESDGDPTSGLDDEEDPDLRALEGAADEPSEDEVEEDEAEAETTANDKAAKPGKEPWKRTRPLRASDVLATTALALWILRVPFTYARMQQAITTNEIPYVDFARTTLIPPEMFRHMNKGVRLSLRPQRSPSPSSLFSIVREFARTITIYFGVKLPEVNYPPVAWHVISQLGGNDATYSQVIRFLELVDANMSITDTVAPMLRKLPNSEETITVMRATRNHDVHMPELSVAAAWVVVMKLAYGLDGLPRLPLIASDPAISMPKRDLWITELDRRVKSGVLKGDMRDMGNLPFHIMNGADIDLFLHRCESVLLKDRPHGTGGSMFPLPRAPTTEKQFNSWAAFHAQAAADPTLQAKAPDPKTPNRDLPLLPGEALRTYKEWDVLPRELEIVMAAAADVVGVNIDAVRDLVVIFERRMENKRPHRPYPSVVARKMSSQGHPLRESRSLSSFTQGQ